MIIKFRLNGKNVQTEAEPNERLIDILREKFGMKASKSACHCGLCGCCTIFFNKILVPSCLIPAFRVQNAEVVTLEGFAETEEYKDIIAGYHAAGVQNCGYCDAGKILIAESLLSQKILPEKETIAAAYNSVKCRCTDRESLVNGVIAAAALRKKRKEHGQRQQSNF